MTQKKYDKPSVTVDILIFTIKDSQLKIALVRRRAEPFKGMWAIPGGFIKINETLDKAAKRELQEETGVKDIYLEQLYTFGDPKRDPRERVITVAYFALTHWNRQKLMASTDVTQADWFDTEKLPPLAFDHQKIIDYALERLRGKLGYSNIAYGLLPEKFRLSNLQKVYEIVLGKKLDKRNFRKKILSLGLLEQTGEKETTGVHRPAMLYRFEKKELILFN